MPAHAAATPVLSDVTLLQSIGVEPLAIQQETGVGYAELTPLQEQELSKEAHNKGKCAGYEVLTPTHGAVGPDSLTLSHVFGQLAERAAKDSRFRPSSHTFEAVIAKPEIESALKEVSESNLKESIEFLSAFHDRYNKGDQPNQAVDALKTRIEAMLKGSKIKFEVSTIDHRSTRQKSLRVRVPGATRPQEIVVLGAHLDSINTSWWGNDEAPGADDNASGTSNLIEALRVLSQHSQPERTIEFMWYAGEESGLLGSAEIAGEYKKKNADVVAVLQLDMTLHPGDGEFTLGSMTDFTSSWLRGYIESLNSAYLKARIVDDKCGYGCSDHASWYRQGYPTVMPFEATFDRMNPNLHTAKDKINSQSSFKHAAMFSRLALAIAMDLGNSTLREGN